MENKIELVFSDDIKSLFGKDLGKKIFIEQVESKIDCVKLNIIVLPSSIENISISFVKGFTEKILNYISEYEFLDYFRICGNQKVVSKFLKSIHY